MNISENSSPYDLILKGFGHARERLNGWSWRISSASEPSYALNGAVWRILTWQRSALEQVHRALPSLLAGWPTRHGEDRARACARLMQAAWLRREWADSLDPAPDLIAAWPLPDPPEGKRVTAWSLGPGPDFAMLAGFDSGFLYYGDWTAKSGIDPLVLLDTPKRLPIRSTVLAGPREKRHGLALSEDVCFATLWNLSIPKESSSPTPQMLSATTPLVWSTDHGPAQAGAIDSRCNSVAIVTSQGILLVWDLTRERRYGSSLLPDTELDLGLKSTTPIVALEFSPEGRALLVANERAWVFPQCPESTKEWILTLKSPLPWMDPGANRGLDPVRAVAIDWEEKWVVACADHAAMRFQIAVPGYFLFKPKPPRAMPAGTVVAASWVAGSNYLALAVAGDPRRSLAWLDLNEEETPGVEPPAPATSPLPLGVGIQSHPAGPIGFTLDVEGWLSAWDPSAYLEHRERTKEIVPTDQPPAPVAVIADRGPDQPLWIGTAASASGQAFTFDRDWPGLPGIRGIPVPQELPGEMATPRWASFDTLGKQRGLVVDTSRRTWLGTPRLNDGGGAWNWRVVDLNRSDHAIACPAWSPLGDQAVLIEGSGQPWILQFDARPADQPDVVALPPPRTITPIDRPFVLAAIGSDGRVTAAREREIVSWANADGTEIAQRAFAIRSGNPVHLDPDRNEVWLWDKTRSILACYRYHPPGAGTLIESEPVGEIRPGTVAIVPLGNDRRLVVAGDRKGWLWAWIYAESSRPGAVLDLRAAAPLGMPIEQVVVSIDGNKYPRVAVRDRAGRLIQFTLIDQKDNT